jgi:hypothetical protein
MAMSDGDPDCVHCAVLDLVQAWINEDREAPQDVILKLAEAVGDLLACVGPDDREMARGEIFAVIESASRKRELI